MEFNLDEQKLDLPRFSPMSFSILDGGSGEGNGGKEKAGIGY